MVVTMMVMDGGIQQCKHTLNCTLKMIKNDKYYLQTLPHTQSTASIRRKTRNNKLRAIRDI